MKKFLLFILIICFSGCSSIYTKNDVKLIYKYGFSKGKVLGKILGNFQCLDSDKCSQYIHKNINEYKNILNEK